MEGKCGILSRNQNHTEAQECDNQTFRKNTKIQIQNKSWKKITYLEALLIGLFQVLAFIPGASRAGVTITGARFLGYDRLNAARFSMILSIPIILASMTLSLINVSKENYVDVNLSQSFTAAIVAFITALLSIIFLMR